MNKLRILILALFITVSAVYAVSALSKALADDTPPVITADSSIIEISVKDGEEALLSGIHASDKQDGDLTSSVMISGISKLVSNNTAKVSYIVFDSDRNIGVFTRSVRYTDYRRPRFSLSEPLIFANGEDITLNGKLSAEDAIDGDISGSIKIVSRNLAANEEGLYSITVQVTNSLGDTALLKLPIMIVNTLTAVPTVELEQYLVYVNIGSDFIPSDYLKAVYDSSGAPAEISAVAIDNTVDLSSEGTYTVTYSYTDASGKRGFAVLTVVVEKEEN